MAARLSALAVVAAVLVGAFFGRSIGRSMVNFVEHRYRQEVEPQASTEEPPDFDEILRLMEGGHARVAPVAVLSIDALLAEYRDNEFAAAAKYENTDSLLECLGGNRVDECRVVETAGTIRDMGRDDSGAYITLATANEFVSVTARFGKAEHESLGTLRRGQRVSVRCMVLNGSAGLLLTRCGVAPEGLCRSGRTWLW